MTLILDVLARAARQCSVVPPSSWLTASDQTSLEVLDFLDQTRTDIADRLDVVGPMSISLMVTGTGAEEYPLPADFLRLQRGEFAVYERFRTRRACVPVSNDGEWQYLQELGVAGAYRFYRLRGYPGAWRIGFQQPLDLDLTAIVSYVSTNWLINGSVLKSAFTSAEDVCLFPRELVEAGIVWRFRQRKGLEYADVQGRYEMLMARYSNDSRSARKINFGKPAARSPWEIPVPDVIPTL
ncbi:MAG: hypothetical protein ACRC6I_13950 [Paracoccaceae bacterium]